MRSRVAMEGQPAVATSQDQMTWPEGETSANQGAPCAPYPSATCPLPSIPTG